MQMLSVTQQLKVDLLADGMSISPSARMHLSKMSSNGQLTLADFASTSGVPLLLPEDIWVNAPISDFNPNFVTTPHHILDWDGKSFTVRNDNSECFTTPLPVPEYQHQVNSKGEPHSWYAVTHTDRVRISPIGGCSNSCKFCDLPRKISYAKKPVSLLIESIHAALNDPILPAKHILISGGTPKKSDYDYLQSVYLEILNTFPSIPIDIMMVPIPEVLDLKTLKAAGAHEVSINIELFNDSFRRDLIPGKNSIPKSEWLSFIEKTATIFESHVRSILMVGLEPIEDTIKGVQALAERGCMPVLSPFRPDPATPLKNVFPPSAQFLAEVYERSVEAIESYSVKLGPQCIPCQHNTLTFPDGSDYYHKEWH
jgi:hypothetical protein